MECANAVFIEQGPQFIFSMTICAPVLRALLVAILPVEVEQRVSFFNSF